MVDKGSYLIVGCPGMTFYGVVDVCLNIIDWQTCVSKDFTLSVIGANIQIDWADDVR